MAYIYSVNNHGHLTYKLWFTEEKNHKFKLLIIIFQYLYTEQIYSSSKEDQFILETTTTIQTS